MLLLSESASWSASQSCPSEQASWSEWISVSGHQLTKHGAYLVGHEMHWYASCNNSFRVLKAAWQAKRRKRDNAGNELENTACSSARGWSIVYTWKTRETNGLTSLCLLPLPVQRFVGHIILPCCIWSQEFHRILAVWNTRLVSYRHWGTKCVHESSDCMLMAMNPLMVLLNHCTIIAPASMVWHQGRMKVGKFSAATQLWGEHNHKVVFFGGCELTETCSQSEGDFQEKWNFDVSKDQPTAGRWKYDRVWHFPDLAASACCLILLSHTLVQPCTKAQTGPF